jgi:hypothetical protein
MYTPYVIPTKGYIYGQLYVTNLSSGYYQYKDSEFKLIANTEVSSDFVTKYYIDGVEVSKSEYNQFETQIDKSEAVDVMATESYNTVAKALAAYLDMSL